MVCQISSINLFPQRTLTREGIITWNRTPSSEINIKILTKMFHTPPGKTFLLKETIKTYSFSNVKRPNGPGQQAQQNLIVPLVDKYYLHNECTGVTRGGHRRPINRTGPPELNAPEGTPETKHVVTRSPSATLHSSVRGTRGVESCRTRGLLRVEEVCLS